MAANSSTVPRLRIDPNTNLPTIQTFGELSQFLRGAVADEESRQVSESMGMLANHVEAIIASLKLTRDRVLIAPMLVDFMTVLRSHRHLVVALPANWRGLYEYAGYLQALNNLRVLIGQWLLDGGPRSTELTLTADDFSLVAWRTLGEGMLMLDMYEQWAGREPEEEGTGLGPLDDSQIERAVTWWKLRR